MWPWNEEPRSIAHGIRDDETYDWFTIVTGMLASGDEGDDTALTERGIASIDSTTRLAQKQFNRWLEILNCGIG
jgi:hypothetical protein